MKQGRFEDAYQSLFHLRQTSLQACRGELSYSSPLQHGTCYKSAASTDIRKDLYYIHVQLQGEIKYLTGSIKGEEAELSALSEEHNGNRNSYERDTSIDHNANTNSLSNPNIVSGTYHYHMQFMSFRQRFVQLFRVPRIRRAALASFAVMLGQQLCGVSKP